MRISPSRLLEIDVLAYLVLFTAVFLQNPLADYDYFWHLKTGEILVHNLALPAGDIFSFTMHGQPWVLHEWGYQIVLYFVHTLFGDSGIRLFSTALLFGALAISFAPARRLGIHPIVILLFLLLYIVPMVPYTQPRPQVITYICFAYFLKCLLDYKHYAERKLLYHLPLLMVMWVNFHGGYIIGLALIGLFAGSETIRAIYHRESLPRVYWITLGSSLLASGLNPYGFAHLLYPFEVFSLVAVNRIQEWLPLELANPLNILFLLLATVLPVLYAIRRRLPDISEVLLPTLFVAAAISSRRHLPLAVLTLIPFTLYAYGGSVNSTVNAYMERFSALSLSNIPAWWRNSASALFALVILGVLIYSFYNVRTEHRHTIEWALPVKVADYMTLNHLSGNVFSPYRYGGYLLYRLYPSIRVFIDGRADLYGDKIFLDYLTIYRAEKGWEKLFKQYQIDYVICEKRAGIHAALLARGDFVERFEDGINVLLARKSAINADNPPG